MFHTPIAAASLIVLAALSGFAAASDPHACTPDPLVAACAGGSEDGGGDPQCSEPDSYYSGMNEVIVRDSESLVAVGASGWASCHNSDGEFGLGDDRGSGVGAAAYTPAGAASTGWSEYEREEDGEVHRDCAIHVAYVAFPVQMGGGVQRECGARGPPNPGWGHLLP